MVFSSWLIIDVARNGDDADDDDEEEGIALLYIVRVGAVANDVTIGIDRRVGAVVAVDVLVERVVIFGVGRGSRYWLKSIGP